MRLIGQKALIHYNGDPTVKIQDYYIVIIANITVSD